VVGAAAEEPESAPAAEPVRLEYGGASGCPDRATFVAQVLARSRRFSFAAGEEELARPVRVALQATDAGFRGELRLIGEDGEAVSRAIDGADCSEVTRALALALVLALPSAAEPEPEPVKAAPAPVLVIQRSGRARPAPRAGHTRASAPRRKLETFAGWSVGGGIGSRAANGFLVGLRVEPEPYWAALRATARYLDTLLVQEGAADARYFLFSLEAAGCVHPRLGGAFALDACAGLEVGNQAARGFADGTNLATGREAVARWSSGLVAARLRWLGSHLGLEAGPLARVPFVRNEFAIDGSEVVLHRTPVVSAGFEAALLGRF
jgi:hypothetical protein